MIKQLTLTDIKDYDKNKDGKPYVGKNGPYVRRTIKVAEKEYEGKTVGGYRDEWNKEWQLGEQVTLDIYETEANGVKYLNFKKVAMTDHLMEMVQNLNNRVESLEKERADRTRGYEIPVRDEKNTPNFSPNEQIDEVPDEAFENY